MGWLHGCTTIVLSCRLGFACAAVQPALCRRERLRENMEIRVCLVDAVIALAAFGSDKREALRGNMLKHVDLRVRQRLVKTKQRPLQFESQKRGRCASRGVRSGPDSGLANRRGSSRTSRRGLNFAPQARTGRVPPGVDLRPAAGRRVPRRVRQHLICLSLGGRQGLRIRVRRLRPRTESGSAGSSGSIRSGI